MAVVVVIVVVVAVLSLFLLLFFHPNMDSILPVEEPLPLPAPLLPLPAPLLPAIPQALLPPLVSVFVLRGFVGVLGTSG